MKARDYRNTLAFGIPSTRVLRIMLHTKHTSQSSQNMNPRPTLISHPLIQSSRLLPLPSRAIQNRSHTNQGQHPRPQHQIPPSNPLNHNPTQQRPHQRARRISHIHHRKSLRIRAIVTENARILLLQVIDRGLRLRKHRREDHVQRHANGEEEDAQQGYLRGGVVVDEAEADEDWGEEEVAEGDDGFGSVAVAEGADEGRGEGGEGEGEEYEAHLARVVGEEAFDVEGKGGLEFREDEAFC